MTWYKTGTVTVTPGSNAVLGAGTSFIANARVGDAFRGPDGEWYEVTNIASDTALSIEPSYQGLAEAAGGYSLAPMQGYVKDSADALRAATRVIASGVADMQEQVAAATEAAQSAGQSKADATEQAGIASAAAEASTDNKDAAQLAAQQSQASAQVAGEAATRSETARDSVIQSEQAAAASAVAAQESADRAEEVTEGKAASGSNSDITSLSGLTTPLSKAQGGTGRSDGIPVMVGATASAAGTPGLVPAGAAGDQEKFLTAGGSFKEAGGGDNIGDIKPWKFSRATIPGGRLPNDGQIVTNGRALYPEFWALIQPFCVTDAVWLAAPYTSRGMFSSGDGSTNFRMPDDNAKHADGNTISAMVFRGDGKNSAGTAGMHQADSMQNVTGQFGQNLTGVLSSVPANVSGAFRVVSPSSKSYPAPAGSGASDGANLVDFDMSRVARTGTETRSANSTVIWCTTVAKTAVNSGSVDVPALATAVSSQGAQIQILQSKAVKRWRSGNLSLSSSATSYPHTLGVPPDAVNVYVTLTASVGSWPVGTVFVMGSQATDFSGSASYGVQVCNIGSSSFVANCATSGLLINTMTGTQSGVALSQCTIQVELLQWPQ